MASAEIVACRADESPALLAEFSETLHKPGLGPKPPSHGQQSTVVLCHHNGPHKQGGEEEKRN